MRQIKFRAWSEEDYEGRHIIPRGMYQVLNLPLWTTAKMDAPLEFCVKSEPDRRYSDRNFSSYVLMQFTGLTDKNGKEIYEGDVVGLLGTSHSFEIFWDDKFGAWSLILQEHGFAPAEDHLLGNCLDDVEVIGNIYENPDLLK